MLDAWIVSQPDVPSRPEAIRRLMLLGLHVASEPSKGQPA